MPGMTWKWCLIPNHSEEAIRKKVLDDYDDICFDYLCRYSRMSPEFHRELAVLSLCRSEGTRLVPYVNKKNYDEMYPIFRETYDWIYDGFNDKPSDTVLGCIELVKFKENTERACKNAERNKKKLEKQVKNASDKQTEKHLKIKLESAINKIERCKIVLKALDMLYSKGEITHEYLKEDLLEAFTDRLPEGDVYNNDVVKAIEQEVVA